MEGEEIGMEVFTVRNTDETWQLVPEEETHKEFSRTLAVDVPAVS